MFEALGIQHVTRMRHIVNCGMLHSTLFIHVILRKARFLGKVTGYQTVFRFSLQIFTGIFLILIEFLQDSAVNVFTLSIRYSFLHFKYTLFLSSL